MTINIPAFSPDKMISAPEGATHFRFHASGAAIDFHKGSYSVAASSTGSLPLGAAVQEAIQLVLTVPPASAAPMFLIFGIEFLQVASDGKPYALANGAFNPMTIVKVDHARP